MSQFFISWSGVSDEESSSQGILYPLIPYGAERSFFRSRSISGAGVGGLRSILVIVFLGSENFFEPDLLRQGVVEIMLK